VVTRVARLRTVVASRWFKLLLSAALLSVLLYETDLEQMRAALAAVDVRWLVLAWTSLIASQVVSAYRWALLARALEFSESFGRFCLYYFSGMFLNLFGPGTVAGDVGRVLFLARGRRRALALTTVVAHRAIGFIALIWIAATAIVLLPDEPFLGALRWLAGLTFPASVAGWLWGPRLAARLLPPTSRWRRVIERDLAPYWDDHRLLALSLGLAAAMHALQIISQMLVARSLALQLPWVFFLVVVPLVNIAGTLPFSLQGIGVREAGYWSYLARIGVPRASALAIGLLGSALVIAGGLTGMPAFLLLRGERGNTDA
jgi:glycosyltransferase 2 family protein